MPYDDLAPLRRLWWLPLLTVLVLGFAWAPLWFFIDRLHPLPFQAYGWSHTALMLGVEIAWLVPVWPRLKVGGAYQVLLALQAAMPLAWAVAGHLFLGRWGAAHSRTLLFETLALVGPLVQIACLAAAFSLRRLEREGASMAVMASAGLLVMLVGWIGIGLGSVLAWIWGDPLPSDLCGEGAVAPKRASTIGYACLVAAVVLAVLGVFPRWTHLSGSSDFLGTLVSVFSLALGGLAWSGMGARMGARDRALTAWAWILILLGFPLMLAVLFLFALMGGGGI